MLLLQRNNLIILGKRAYFVVQQLVKIKCQQLQYGAEMSAIINSNQPPKCVASKFYNSQYHCNLIKKRIWFAEGKLSDVNEDMKYVSNVCLQFFFSKMKLLSHQLGVCLQFYCIVLEFALQATYIFIVHGHTFALIQWLKRSS